MFHRFIDFRLGDGVLRLTIVTIFPSLFGSISDGHHAFATLQST